MRPDLIIIGAGSAGCVIARRASEHNRRSVLLLEAGPDYPELAAVPTDLTDGRRNSMNAHDWGYRHKPTSAQQLLFRFPRGRVVGGSSAVNTCIALRGQPEDYDEWNSTVPGWSWSECLPAFKAIEHDLDVQNEFHGQTGPLPVRRHPQHEWVDWQAAFVDACRESGFPACDDSNRPGSHGVGPHAMNKVAGRRVSAAQAFLTPEVRARDNFELRAETMVRRVLFRNRRVTGVEVEGPRGVETLSTPHVVLCAGAINTPGILLRSGLGPRTQVERLGCTPIADVPGVGRRLLDHPGTAIFLRPRWRALTSRHDPLIQTVLRYPSSREHSSDMLLQPGSKLPMPNFDVPLLLLMCSVGKPRGTGRLHWTSADPRARPVIESQLLADGGDRSRAVAAMELAYALMQTAPLRALASCLWPSARVLRRRDRISDWISRGCDSGYHPCGTAPMGPSSDVNAVTDGRGRVYAVEGLTIADASLMPTIPSSNIHLPVLMIGERIGAMLRDEPC
jgi:choline dehydrogenase